MDFEYGPRLPRILCLHGGGTSAAIFKIQTRYLQWAMAQSFEFVFLDAPWPSQPGPGVTPCFEEMGPFYRWERPSDYVPNDDAPSPPKLDILPTLRRVLQSEGGEWAGVLGFSQGGRVAAGLLRECQEGLLDDLLPPGEKFRFGLLCGASYPPIYITEEGRRRWSHPPTRPLLTPQGQPMDGKEHRVFDPSLEGAIVGIPSIHVQGMRDPVLDMSKMLLRCFDQRGRKHFLLDIGHHLPKSNEQNRLIVSSVLEAYRREVETRAG